jgi:hypothetical protein
MEQSVTARSRRLVALDMSLAERRQWFSAKITMDFCIRTKLRPVAESTVN